MGTNEGQYEGLEARLAGLEARIARLEASRVPGAPNAQDMHGAPPAPVATAPSTDAQAPPSAATTQPARPSYWRSPDTSPAQPSPQAAIVSATQGPASVPVQTASSSPASPRLAVSLGDLEERLAGRALAVVGGIALILGAIFFLSLAFSRGWIGPELRVLIGLAAGSAAVAGGGVFLERGDRLLGNVLTPVGLAIISISLIGATRLYHIVPTELGLIGALLSAAVVALIAVRNDSQLVAGFGSISVLLAPPLLEASPDTTTLAFIGVHADRHHLDRPLAVVALASRRSPSS